MFFRLIVFSFSIAVSSLGVRLYTSRSYSFSPKTAFGLWASPSNRLCDLAKSNLHSLTCKKTCRFASFDYQPTISPRDLFAPRGCLFHPLSRISFAMPCIAPPEITKNEKYKEEALQWVMFLAENCGSTVKCEHRIWLVKCKCGLSPNPYNKQKEQTRKKKILYICSFSVRFSLELWGSHGKRYVW